MFLNKNSNLSPSYTFTPQTNDNFVCEIKTSITSFIAKDQYEEAFTFLLNHTSFLQEEQQFEKKFLLELFFVNQVAKSNFYNKTYFHYQQFLFEMHSLVKDKLLEQNYLVDFSNLLLSETLSLAEVLKKKESYTQAINIYDLAINFFLTHGLHYVNVITLQKGDLYKSIKQIEQAAKTYKDVFLNLYRLVSSPDYQLSQNKETKQLTDALEKIIILNTELNSNIYKNTLILLKTNIPKDSVYATLKEIMRETLESKNYNLYLNLSYLFSFLFLVAKKQLNKEINFFTNDLDFMQNFKNLRVLAYFIQVLQEETSIFKAIENNELEKLQVLLNANISLDIGGPQGATPLQYAIIKKRISIVELLIKAGVNVNETFYYKDKNPLLPPIYLAIQSEEIQIVELLLEADVDINPHKKKYKESPLHYAIKQGKEKIAEELLKKGACLWPNEILSQDFNKNNLYLKLFRKNSELKFLLFKPASNISPLLRPLKSGNNIEVKIPIFCLHALDGSGEYPYMNFAKNVAKLDPSRPVYAIDTPSASSGQQPNTIEEIAEIYIEAIKTRQPVGPYILLGWSFGGLLAYAIALKLKERGDEVILCVMVDTLAPVMMQQLTKEQYYHHLLVIMEKLTFLQGTPTKVKTDIAQEEKEKQISLLFRLNEVRKDRQKFAETIVTNLLATLKYQPPVKNHAGPFVTCFNSEASCEKYASSDFGWYEQNGNNVGIRIVGKNHFSILTSEDLSASIAKFICQHKLTHKAESDRRYYLAKAQLNNLLKSFQTRECSGTRSYTIDYRREPSDPAERYLRYDEIKSLRNTPQFFPSYSSKDVSRDFSPHSDPDNNNNSLTSKFG